MTAEEFFQIELARFRGTTCVALEFAGVRVLLTPAAALRIARRIEQAAKAIEESAAAEKKRKNRNRDESI